MSSGFSVSSQISCVVYAHSFPSMSLLMIMSKNRKALLVIFVSAPIALNFIISFSAASLVCISLTRKSVSASGWFFSMYASILMYSITFSCGA